MELKEAKRAFVYIAGDIMSSGSQYELKQIIKDVELVGLPYYSPVSNASINDKKNVSEAENNTLAERIVAADSEQLERADVIIFNIKQHALGTLVELGQCLQMKRDNPNLRKKFICLYDDIRRETNLNERNDRRSWSINQYVYGAVLELTGGVGFIPLSELFGTLYSYHIEFHNSQVGPERKRNELTDKAVLEGWKNYENLTKQIGNTVELIVKKPNEAPFKIIHEISENSFKADAQNYLEPIAGRIILTDVTELDENNQLTEEAKQAGWQLCDPAVNEAPLPVPGERFELILLRDGKLTKAIADVDSNGGYGEELWSFFVIDGAVDDDLTIFAYRSLLTSVYELRGFEPVF